MGYPGRSGDLNALSVLKKKKKKEQWQDKLTTVLSFEQGETSLTKDKHSMRPESCIALCLHMHDQHMLPIELCTDCAQQRHSHPLPAEHILLLWPTASSFYISCTSCYCLHEESREFFLTMSLPARPASGCRSALIHNPTLSILHTTTVLP